MGLVLIYFEQITQIAMDLDGQASQAAFFSPIVKKCATKKISK